MANKVMIFVSKKFLEYLQQDIGSFLLFRVDTLGLHKMKYFSHKLKLHFFIVFE